MCVLCVICEEREKGEGLRRRAGRASASPGQQTNIHAVLAKGLTTPTTREHKSVTIMYGKNLPGHQGSAYFRHCMTTGFGPLTELELG